MASLRRRIVRNYTNYLPVCMVLPVVVFPRGDRDGGRSVLGDLRAPEQ